ncbi:uncharacterized protein LOC123543191 [Mercenaria mercenaria]|uniref:uncharacterized protein LOC123543191 n=1 Tax=Mercenaria mercenaria TaxID=6596 RepID=UPI00234EAA8D|nr:uncharacterized protein LOC123543191 [Mercenaria mercenaria]
MTPYDNPVGNFSTLSAMLSFKRSKNSLSIMYIAPPIIIVVVSMTSFLLGENTGSRITVPTGALTQLVMQWAAIYSKLPSVPVLTYFDKWMLMNLISVGTVLFVNACICHLVYSKGEEISTKKSMEMKIMANDDSSQHPMRQHEENMCRRILSSLKRNVWSVNFMAFFVLGVGYAIVAYWYVDTWKNS